MKLLFFSNTLKGGGAERVLANLTSALERRGHIITIALNFNESHYELSSRIKIVGAENKKWYQGRNIFRVISRTIKMNIFYGHFTREVIKDEQPDVIITFMQCNIGAIIKHHGSIPIIHSEHNAYDRKLGIKNYYNRFFLNRFYDKVCVLTPFDKGYAVAKGLRNVVVMPNPNTFECISEADYKSQFPLRKNIYVCGRLKSWNVKGLDLAIDAFSKIADKYPDIDLDIIGDGDGQYISFLKKLAEERGVDKRIHFLGFHTDILDLIRQHKLFILTSRTEGFPMVVTEAMSQGVSCVSFERLASSIIVNNQDGILVDDGSVSSIANAISYLLNNESRMYELGCNAISNISRFSSEAIAERWERLFCGLLN